VLLGVYRPDSHSQLLSAFYDDLSAVFERLASYSCPVVVCGDVNVDVDQSDDDVNAARLDQTCSRWDTFSTCRSLHTMPGTLSTSLSPGVTRVAVTSLYVGAMISDHAVICFKLNANKSIKGSLQTVTSRAWRRLSRDALEADLAASRLCSDLDKLTDMSVHDLAKLYRDVMTELLDRHCPVVTVRRRVRPLTEWFVAVSDL